MKLPVINIKGEDTGRKVDLSEVIFKAELNDHAIYLDVKQYLANQRQGTSMAKDRSLISGSTRKIKKQKGTGSARAGSIKSPIFRGGGTIFGPEPRDYHFKLNKKLKVNARRSALSYKIQDKSLTIVEDFDFESPKTKNYLELLSAFTLENKKTLLVLPENKKNVYLSSRNLKKAKVITADQINTYDVLHADNILMLEGSVEKITNILN
ncbi:MAG: 50S ribosomal protein L4 [Cyclobacteriaceae bacterium]|nr:50S ribosomal protein L4 [Cyclobacteriaceae bacterium]